MNFPMTTNDIANRFGCTREQLQAQYERNAVTARLADIYRMILIGRSNAQRMDKLRAKKAKIAAARELRWLKRGMNA